MASGENSRKRSVREQPGKYKVHHQKPKEGKHKIMTAIFFPILPSSSSIIDLTTGNGEVGIMSCSLIKWVIYSVGNMSLLVERNCPTLTHHPRSSEMLLQTSSARYECFCFQKASRCSADNILPLAWAALYPK